jgi:integrase
LSLPNPDIVRQRIESVNQDDIRFCLMTCYLYAGRISEVVGVKYPSDTKTEARGPRGSDVVKDVFMAGMKKFPCAIFTVRTAKREGKERKIALPLNPAYEPWTKRLYEYFKTKGDDLVFPFPRQQVWAYSKTAFEGLTYPIETYSIKQGEVVKKVDEHLRPFRLHALRHLRATELREHYQFDGFDLASYCGWRLGTIVPQISRTMERYLSLGWASYFPKLLKKRVA